MNCKYLIDGKCEIASKIAENSAKVVPSLCLLCEKQDKPYSINRATILTAINSFPQKSDIIRSQYNYLFFPTSNENEKSFPKQRLDSILNDNGVGSQLWKLLEKIGVSHTASCKCLDWAERMNNWGPDGCRLARKEIVEHMANSAKNYGWSTIPEAVIKAIASGLVFRINPLDPYGSLLDEAIKLAEESELKKND